MSNADAGSSSLFSPKKVCSQLCIICNDVIKKRDVTQEVRDISSFKSLAVSWSKLDIPKSVKEYCYLDIIGRIETFELKKEKIQVHASCRSRFRNYLKRYSETYKKKSKTEEQELGAVSSTTPLAKTRSKSLPIVSLQRQCFVCNLVRKFDGEAYNMGGLRRCDNEDTAKKILNRKEVLLSLNDHKLYSAAKRLDVILSGFHDIFAADVYIHQSCYLKFAINPVQPKTKDTERTQREDDVLSEFKFKLKTKIIRDQEAFLLHELLRDLRSMSTEQGLENPPIKETRTLRRYIEKNFEHEISLYALGKYLVVYPSDVNPCTYSIATLRGMGLRDLDILKSFGRMIRRKIEEKKKNENRWPLTPEELLSQMDDGPLQELYNAIYFCKHEHGTLNDYGYAITSVNKATKIWSIACDLESFITGERSTKQIVLGLYLHRLTGNKEGIAALHKSNHVISYDDICTQNGAWAQMISSRSGYYPAFRRGVVTHSTLDNNDGRQETMTGSGTTHDTNKTLFQLPTKKELLEAPRIGDTIRPLDICEEIIEACSEPQPYELGTRHGPPMLPNFKLSDETNEIDASFKRDIAWSLAGLLEGDDYPLLGSWTPFNKKVSDFDTIPCVQEYLPVTPHPPEYPVCKEYLDFLLELTEELQIPYIFVHSDEMVYAKLCDILWKDRQLYSRIILIMGGFHQLRVMQRLIYKRHDSKGYKQWCKDANTIAGGSADQAFEGRHYFRSMRVHKECFDALVQFRIEKLYNGLLDLDERLLEKVKLLRMDPSPTSLSRVVQSNQFDELVEAIINCDEGSDGDMTVAYLKDVSIMLSLVSAVREANIEKHLQAERQMVYLTFSYDHQNYARYVTYQNSYLTWLKQNNHEAYNDLSERGMGGSLSGDAFSTIHGDLITELFNKETKGTGGPFRAGFSTNPEAVNKWVHTIHTHAVLRKALRTSLHMKSSSQHKEVTNRGKKLHQQHVTSLKKILVGYGTDPFSNNPPRCISTGCEIPNDVVADMIRAPKLGESLYKDFILQRLVNNTVGFFMPIRKNKLKTGIMKTKAKPKANTVLKEDCQAFGVIISKSISNFEAFSHCITSIPLSVATPEGELRQSDKASLRNYLIEEASATSNLVPEKAAWFVDGLAAIRTLKPKETFEEWIHTLLRFITPTVMADATIIGMINDTYSIYSTKAGTRKKRGEGSRIHVKGVKQHMPSGIKWQEFLGNSANKEELINLIFEHFQNLNKQLNRTLIYSKSEETYKITGGNCELIYRSNHEEADARLILQAYLEKSDVVIVCKDTDVLVLMVWAYTFYDISNKWYFKYDSEKYADISKICHFFGRDLCLSLPAFHAVTGCDTTSYFFRAGKVRVLKKLIANPSKCIMLKSLGKDKELNKKNIDLVKKFIQTVVYSGRENEDYVATRIRLYQGLKSKSSMPLPPDPDSAVQVIKRVHCQVYQWIRCCTPWIDTLSLEENGWIVNEEGSQIVIKPRWFTGSQLPPSSLNDKKKKKKKSLIITSGDIADDDLTDQGNPTKRKRQKIVLKKKSEGNAMVVPIPEEFVSTSNVNTFSDNDHDADEESEGLEVLDETGNTSMTDDWEDWEDLDFLSTDNDSADEWLP